jgi:hypothetical protein
VTKRNVETRHLSRFDTRRTAPRGPIQRLAPGIGIAVAKLAMVLKIELVPTDSGAVFMLIGRITSQDVQRLKVQLADAQHRLALDLGQVHLVDLDAVHFLAEAQCKGIELRRPPPYVREWIRLEALELKRTEGINHGTHVGGGLRQRDEGV